MNKILLFLFLSITTLGGLNSCSKSNDSEIENNSSIIGTWKTADGTEQMIAVFGTDKSLTLTVKINGKTSGIETYSYFTEGNKLTTVFIESTIPSSTKKKGDIDVNTITLKGDTLILGELTYTRSK